jgi:hypothetical protein
MNLPNIFRTAFIAEKATKLCVRAGALSAHFAKAIWSFWCSENTEEFKDQFEHIALKGVPFSITARANGIAFRFHDCCRDLSAFIANPASGRRRKEELINSAKQFEHAL